MLSGGGFEYLGELYEVLNGHTYVSTELKDSSDDIKSTYKFKTDNATGCAAYGNESIEYENGFEVGDIVYVATENTYTARDTFVTHVGYHKITSVVDHGTSKYCRTELLGTSYIVNICSKCGHVETTIN